MLANGEQTVLVLKTCLAHSSILAQANSASWLCGLIHDLDSAADRTKFSALIKDLCSSLECIAADGRFNCVNTPDATDSFVQTAQKGIVDVLESFSETNAESELAELRKAEGGFDVGAQQQHQDGSRPCADSQVSGRGAHSHCSGHRDCPGHVSMVLRCIWKLHQRSTWDGKYINHCV